MKKIYTILLNIFFIYAAQAQVSIVKSPLYMYQYISTLNDKMLFFATEDIFGSNNEIWVSDGTGAGTNMLKDIQPGSASSTLSNTLWGPQYGDKEPVVYQNEIYFLADDGVHGMEIWKTDGTEVGTILLKDINVGPQGFFYPEFNYPYFTEMDGILFFAANDGTHGFELWKTDGTEAGTEMVKDISTDGLYGSNPEHLINYNGTLIFTARDDIDGYEIYKSDGTEAGTEIITDIIPGINGAMNNGYASSIDPHFTVSGDYLYFVGRIDVSLPIYYYLYRTDGTETGTITLNNDLQNITDITDVNGTCFLYAFDGDYNHSGLWKTDGSISGTQLVNTDNNFAYNHFYNFDNTLFFNGGNDTYSQLGLYKSDGTTAGTEIVNTFEGLGSFPEVGDYISMDGFGSFFYRALFKITESSMDWRYVQTNGTTEETKTFYGVSPFRAGAFLDDKFYFPGIDSASDTWAFFSLSPEIFETTIKNLVVESTLDIYPNPASENITVEFPKTISQGVITIYNIQGEIMIHANIQNETSIIVKTFGWTKGFYLIKIESDGMIYRGKLSIEH